MDLSQEPLRVGVLGAARIAPKAIIHPARAVPGVAVAAVAARDRSRGEAFARKHDIPRVHDSYEALVADDELDAVYIPLPNGLHGVWTSRALEAGRHVLCEKPFTADADEAREVADVAARSDRVVMEAFHWRYHPLADRMLEIIASGELGEVRRVEAALCAPVPRTSDIRWDLELAGGSMMDMGCYTVSQVRTLAGAEPRVVAARAKELTPGVDRWLQADLEFPNGITGRITTGMLSGHVLDLHCRVVGSEGTLRVLNPVMPQLFSRLSVRGRNGRRVERPSRRPTYTWQLEAFERAVRHGQPVITDPAWSVANMEVIDACYLAAGMQPRRPSGAAAGPAT